MTFIPAAVPFELLKRNATYFKQLLSESPHPYLVTHAGREAFIIQNVQAYRALLHELECARAAAAAASSTPVTPAAFTPTACTPVAFTPAGHDPHADVAGVSPQPMPDIAAASAHPPLSANSESPTLAEVLPQAELAAHPDALAPAQAPPPAAHAAPPAFQPPRPIPTPAQLDKTREFQAQLQNLRRMLAYDPMAELGIPDGFFERFDKR